MSLLWNWLPGGRPSAVSVAPGALRAGEKVGPWRVVRPLGGGGGGAVYLVRRWGRHYALKLAVYPGDKRLEREGRLLRRVRHPGVVKLLGRGWWKGRKRGFPYLVMQYVEGLPLYEWARGTNPTARQLVGLLAQAARALEAVHQQRSVHRDVKGANTLVSPGGQRLVLMDLGAGDYEGATPLTSHVLPPGTEVYLSPEAMAFAQAHATEAQAHYKAQPTDDLYSLGVMAHRVLTDEYPFSVHMPRDLFWLMVTTQPAPNAREKNPRVPAELAATVQRLLAKRPEERHASAREVAEALEQSAKEGGPEWDVPLFEWHGGPGPASRTTQAAAPAGPVAPGQRKSLLRAREEHRKWQRWMRQRQGIRRRSPSASPAKEPAPAPPTHAAPSASKQNQEWKAAGGVLVLMLALALGVAALTQRSTRGGSVAGEAPTPTGSGPQGLPTHGVGNFRQEVARPLGPLDAGTGAAPSETATPAPVAPATQPKETTRVNPPAKPAPARGPKIAKVLPLCVGMACSAGTQAMRPDLPPEECPPGAEQAMEELGIPIGELYSDASFIKDLFAAPSRITVKEGWSTVILLDPFGDLPRKTLISGRLLFSERIHGRFTVARLPDDSTVPICMELWQEGKRGMERERGSTEDNVIVFSNAALRAVDRFK